MQETGAGVGGNQVVFYPEPGTDENSCEVLKYFA